MHRPITRREFVDGFARVVITGAAAGAWGTAGAATAPSPAPYPPGRTGYGGSGPADFGTAHAVRDGRRYAFGDAPVEERYDVVIVGAGIGALATAHNLRRRRPGIRILLLDNHDDFGGHARRNEFNVDGRFLVSYGGSESMEGPRKRWSPEALQCIAELGVRLERFEEAFHVDLYPGMGLTSGLFFPREVYGVDRLVTGDPVRSLPTDVPAARLNSRPAAQFLADCPVSDEQRARLLDMYTGNRDVLAGMSQEQKQKLLWTTSYREYQQRYFGLDEKSLAMFGGRTKDLFASKTEAVPAMMAWGCELPGFQGLGLVRPPEGVLEGDPYIYHFPDGNASLARLFVRELIPGVAPGSTMEDIVTSRFDYARLDQPGNEVRLRLASTVVALRNQGTGAEVLYVRDGGTHRVAADHVVYTGYSAMLPYICPELAGEQRSAVAQQVKAPLVYVKVALRNWRSWVNRRIHYVNNPAGFYSHLKLDYPISLGDYRFPTHPDEPMLLHMIHVPWPEGAIKDLRSAWRAGRAQVYARSFAEFEHHARDELTRILGPGGFDADRDIAAITVNRWGHGYAYDMDPLFEDPAAAEALQEASARQAGRIHFAGTDAGWMAYAHVAMDTAHRAAGEITGG